MNTDDFANLWRDHKSFVEQKCDYLCPKKYIFFLHEELQKLTDYVDWIRDPNLNEAFWWYNQKIWNGKDVPDNVTMSW